MREDSMSTNSSIEREDRVVSEVLVVLGEMGRGDLVEGLGEVVECFNNRILNLVVENVNLDSCNTDLDTKNTDLILEIKDLERDMERLESVLEDKDTEIEELNEKLASVRIGV
jgi:predicted RNase H-like nuclease (RuvC/YqgF family)